MYEARDGTMWAGSSEGVVWYDGFEWQRVVRGKNDTSNETGTIIGELKDSILLHFSDGTMYLGRKTFRKLDIEKTEYVALMDNDIILTQNKGRLWQIKNEFMNLYSNKNKLFPERIFILYPVRVGTVLLDAPQGLFKLQGNSFTILFRSETERIRLNSVQENEHGNGIVSIEHPASSRGIWNWDSTGKITQEKTEGKDIVVAVAIGADGERIAVYRTGLVRSTISGKWETVYENAELRKTQSVCIGKNGDIWFATTNGVFVYRRSVSRWRYWKHPSPDFRNACNEILKSRDGKFWIATTNGVDIRDANGNVRTIESIHGKRLFVVTGLAEDSSGNIWISSGSSFTGTYRWDGKEWTFFDPWHSVDEGWIHKIYVDAQRRIWFLGIGKYTPRHGAKQPGVYMYENEKFTHLGEEDGLISGRVYSFAYASDSSLWFGTYKGLTRLKNRVWRSWSSRELNAGRVFTMALDSLDRLWLGFNDYVESGLKCLEPNGTIHHYTTNDGLTDNNVWDIRVDRQNKIWVSTSNGINCFNNGLLMSYDERSGLKSSGGNWPILPLNDYVYVGTTGEGVAVLDRNKELTPPPRIILDPPLVEEHDALLRWKALSFYGEFSPENVPTRYRVNNGDWSAWSKKHEVELKHLDPGSYIIQVQAKGLIGSVNVMGKQATFTIAPSIFLRPIFYYPAGITSLFIIGLLLMLHRGKVRRRREIAVSEEKFRAVATTTASAIFVFQDEQFLFANHSAETITGYAQYELMQKSFWDLLHPEGLDEVKMFMQEWLTKTSVSRRFECKILTKKNETKWLDVTAARISFMNSLAVIVSAFDITTKKNAEMTLKENEERYRIITELTTDYAYLDRIEEDGSMTVLWISESVYRMTGYTVEETKAPDFFQRYVHPDDLQEGLMYMSKFMSGKTISHDVRVIKKDGTVLWVHNEARPVWNDEHTRVAYMYGAAHDITQRKLDEEQKRVLTSELVQTEERERRRMAVYLHDIIGQHLAVGKLKLREIMKSDISPEVEKQLQEISLNLDKAIKDSRSLTFELSPPALQDVRFDIAVKMLAEQLMSKHNIGLHVEHDELEKSLQPELKVLLYYAVRELFFNIIKHACASEVKLVMLRTESELRIFIEDNGAGFDVNEALTRTKGATGFGLKNVYERMEQIGAKFDIISAYLKGTSVIIAVPMKKMIENNIVGGSPIERS